MNVRRCRTTVVTIVEHPVQQNRRRGGSSARRARLAQRDPRGANLPARRWEKIAHDSARGWLNFSEVIATGYGIGEGLGTCPTLRRGVLLLIPLTEN